MSETITNKIYMAVRGLLNASSIMVANGGYITQVFDGIRENVPESAYPCIVLEPGQDEERMASADTTRKKWLVFQLRILCYMECTDYDNQIMSITNPASRGILDMVNDVKNAIDTYPQLNYDGTGARCDWYIYPHTSYSPEQFPFRIADITMQVTKLTAGSAQR